MADLRWNLSGLKKKLPNLIEEKRGLIEHDHPKISVRRQCELIGLNRSALYYQPAMKSELNLRLMRLIDEQYTKTPFYGWPRMTAHLRRQGHEINHKRVQRLMQQMGIQAIYPKQKTTIASKEHKIYPYLLRDLKIIRPNQVWSTDITYLPMSRGFMYLVAVMDWFSRYVISWQLSNTLDGHFCRYALQTALDSGDKPEIFNSDQGGQFTARSFTSILEAEGVRVSMDGRGRSLDNIFIERLWRSLKYEDIYLKDYHTVPDLEKGLQNYFNFYNFERPHQSLDYHTPSEVHFS